MPYEESKTVKLVGKFFVVFLLLLFFIMLFHERMQKAYFDLVVTGCQKINGLENVVWHEVSSFDAEVRYFYGTNNVEISFTKCVSFVAGFLVEDKIAQIDAYRPDAKTALSRSASGELYGQPNEIFGFAFIEYYGADSQDTENGY